MKKIYILWISLLALYLGGCEDHEAGIYKGDEFIQFTKTAIPFPVMSDGEQIAEIAVGVSKAPAKDQTFNIVVDEEKTTAVAGTHYELVDHSVTIPAGKYTGTFKVKGLYENATPNGVFLALKLDAAPELINADYGNTAIVQLYQYCEFSIDEMAGTYLCIPGFPYDEATQYEVELVKKDEKTGTLIELYDTGMNVDIVFNTNDPSNFYVTVANQPAWLHANYGDIYVQTNKYLSPFSMCKKTITLNLEHWVPGVGTFGEYTSYLEKID